MARTRKTHKSEKIKVGTRLDKALVERLKVRSVMEGKNFNTLLEDAILRYETSGQVSADLRMKALRDFLGIRFKTSPRDFKAMMDEDVYDQ